MKLKKFGMVIKKKKNLNVEYFGVGDLEVSNNDKYLGYSLDLKGSEYYSIFIRDIKTNKIISKEITETAGGITFSLDDKYIFYSKLIKIIEQEKFLDMKLEILVRKMN